MAYDRGAAIMSQMLKRAAAVTGTVFGLGVLATGCLTRPVVSNAPTLKTNFTDSLDNTAVDKVDILFMIDNSASMGDKQVLLADAVPDMLNRLVTPNCIGANGQPNGTTADQNGTCATGAPEFSAVHDMHIGIVSSSLGGRGGANSSNATYASGDQCNPGSDGTIAVGSPGTTPVHMNDKGELLNRAGEDEHTVSSLGTGGYNYLAWYPNIAANKGGSSAPQPAVVLAGQTNTYATADVTLNPLPDDTTLIGAFQDMVVGVHEQGCGYEAQLESWYRFLIEPNPYASIVYSSDSVPVASYQGVDSTIIQQRAAFLRPDSLVAVIVVTDENQEVADPLQLSGTAWAFENQYFPGSPGWAAGYGATEGTTTCQTKPEDPGCQCCATIKDPTTVAADCKNQADSGSPIYYTPSILDMPNVRFFHMKQRFGVDVGFPSSRYVNGLTAQYVPKQSYDRNADGSLVACTNPLYAATLPANANTGTELCNLPVNTTGRTPGGNLGLVYYAAITGVPHQLLQATPGGTDGVCAAGTLPANCPQKDSLSAADWLTILGQDPENYNFTGVDFHMLESWIPRDTTVQAATGAINASACLPANGAADNCDPINGREFDTTANVVPAGGYADLEYACTFAFAAPKDCTQPQYHLACDCEHDPDSGVPLVPNGTSSLCAKTGNTYTTQQVYGKAYPAIEELSVARQMGNYGIVSSLCPIHTQEQGTDDPLYGYRPAVNAIINRLKAALQVACPPHRLQVDPTSGLVTDCLVLATWKTTTGMPASCAAAGGGYSNVADPSVLANFKNTQYEQWLANGGPQSGTPNPETMLTCEIQAVPAVGGQCNAGNNSDQGWCYVENTGGGASDAGPACSYQILFANGGPDKKTTVSLTCVEQAGGGDGG
jgi:hypothetical protein